MAGPGGKGKADEEGPQISAEERARIARAARQMAAYANFLRWTANFRKDELLQHPRHERVVMLSPMQSGRFAFAVQGDTLHLGVQPFEETWIACLPLSKVYVADRLYLAVDGVPCMDGKLSPLAVGVFVDDAAKRARMATAKWFQPVRMRVDQGRVSAVDRDVGRRVPVEAADIVTALAHVAASRLRQQDMSRFF